MAMNRLQMTFIAAATLVSSAVIADDQSSKAPPLSPEQSIATMEIQPGFRLVPVLAEPHIHEPSAIAWDGNGRLYVVEMRTYMQDIDGNNAFSPTSRVSRHEDTDGDGVYDKHTVFADNLVLPRMVLPLLDRVIIRETNTLDLKSYQDTDNDGVADRIEMWHEGGDRGGNLEHQPSGLIWNIDNWIYTTYSSHRYRFTTGQVVLEPLPHGSGQWGLTHDNVGRIFYSTAGGENPAMDFQQPIIYGELSLPGEQAPGFRDVFPIDNVPDVQGGRGRVRDDNTLNKFTGCCGQSIYRGDRMPPDFNGDLIIPEPVGRLIRRAKVTNDNGRIIVSNAYDQQEFIAARDPNFRPVNSATGPDGCLYIVDMYRGIIQEGNWVNEGSYLRGIVQEYELEKNIGRGRIFRVDHDSTNRGPQPRMLDETPAQLVSHLSHPNGWWRSESQKLIVLHGDKSVVGALEDLARNGQNPLGRLHALWTLEGLDAVSSQLLADGCVDPDRRVRAASVRISELQMAGDRSLDLQLHRLARDPDPNVAIQTLLSVSRGGHPEAEAIVADVLKSHPDNDSIQSIAGQMKARVEAMIVERKRLEEMRQRNKALAESVVRGKAIYTTLCTTCHGENGKGQPSPDQDGLRLAPPLAGSARVVGHKERLNRILLHGLMGPVEGNVYSAGLMLPMGANDDRWIADVANYIRNNWENKASLVEASDVARVRIESQKHVGPWTLKELTYFDPPAIEDRDHWKLSASHNENNLRNSLDGNPGSRWDTGTTQKPGMWVSIELPEPVKVMSLTLDTRGSDMDYPRGFVVHVSTDGQSWGDPVAKGQGDVPVTEIELDSPVATRHLRITQTGESDSKYWSIHELSIQGLSTRDKPLISLSEQLAEMDSATLARLAAREGNALRGAKLFYQQTLSCAKCHDPVQGERLGPDLAAQREGVTDPFLVESLLDPSREIRKEFLQTIIMTIDGLVVTGFQIRENDDALVIREPAGGAELSIPQSDIDETRQSNVSAMPAGLVNQLENREQFLDLVQFLISINRGGPSTLEQLKRETTGQ